MSRCILSIGYENNRKTGYIKKEVLIIESTQSIRSQRRPKGSISSLATNFIHRRNPWVILCWSFFFPGFGQISLGSYIKGFLLIVWELIINMNAKINQAIIYSFTGNFELAKNILDKRWALLYTGVFVYAAWDSYRSTVDLNKFSLLADRENSPILPFKISTLEINYFDKRSPWLAFAWSALMPGVGHLYNHRLPTGFIVLIWWIAISYFSHFYEALVLTGVGAFHQATAVCDFQWLLFLPSLCGFVLYDAYTNTVEYNKLFEFEQSKFLKDHYQDSGFEMPL